MEIDPVCGMQVEKASSAAKAEYLGTTFYFCSSACHKAFTARPETYASKVTPKPAPGAGVKHRG